MKGVGGGYQKGERGISCVYIVFLLVKNIKKSYPCDECSRVMLAERESILFIDVFLF